MSQVAKERKRELVGLTLRVDVRGLQGAAALRPAAVVADREHRDLQGGHGGGGAVAQDMGGAEKVPVRSKGPTAATAVAAVATQRD